MSLNRELVSHVKNGRKFQSLSQYFLGKDLAQGSEPSRRVFPSRIQVCWQNERLRLTIAVLSVPPEICACSHCGFSADHHLFLWSAALIHLTPNWPAQLHLFAARQQAL